ncbi:MAG: hypothetical protein ACRC1T_11370 [Clostridium chrysemydis]|uniref:hypothetical protein n=1 Tax=Clostridium chrysemydis TaxID=2665504 RepID=UPI003F3F95C1
MKDYKIDYFSKYYFYEIDDFKREESGEFIIENIEKSSRFDYKGYSYKYTKFNNISKGETIKDAILTIDSEKIDILLNGDLIHLDLNYKFEVQELEDHFRIGTKLSEKFKDASLLIYVNKEIGKEFIDDLEKVKTNILNNMKRE